MADAANAENAAAAGAAHINNVAANIELIGNPFNNNRNRNGQNNLLNMRDRLFHAIYFKVALMYAQIFPKSLQRVLEYFILFKALLFFFVLCYIHTTFIKHPASCLQDIKDWPRDGVLRVEVIPNLDKRRALLAKTKADEQLIRDLQTHYHYGIGPQTQQNHKRLKEYEKKLTLAGYQLRPTYAYANETLIYYFKTEAIAPPKGAKKTAKTVEKPAEIPEDDKQYIVEYSLEYGHLRLSQATRKHLRIPVRVVQLDPMTNKCFGDRFTKFLLKELLGYDDVLMASVRVIAEKEDNKGYLRNVITGEHYRFVTLWWAAWGSYPTAFLIMLLFTLSTSMLLRFSHHQIFIFIVDLLQMLEFNVAARFPIAPLLTVILALVGMEAIMSEFFKDTTTAFYIILIVWIADQYDAVCCHTPITKRHWLKFFYLYHFAFYAYQYRFCGQNRSLALVCSWLFTQHSMFYFFHHYELPVIMQQAQVLIIARNQNAAAAPPANALRGQQQDQQQQPPTIMINRLFDAAPLLADGQNLRRLPLVGGLMRPLLAHRGAAVNSIRRALFGVGRMAPVRVRVQFGNLQRINLGSIHIHPENSAAAAAEAEAAGETTNATTTAAATTTTAAATTTEAAAVSHQDTPSDASRLNSDAAASSAVVTVVVGSACVPAANSGEGGNGDVETMPVDGQQQGLTAAVNSVDVSQTITLPTTATKTTMHNKHIENGSSVSQQQQQQQQQQQEKEEKTIHNSLKDTNISLKHENMDKQNNKDIQNIAGVVTATVIRKPTAIATTTTNNYLPTSSKENSNLTQLENKSHTKEHLSSMVDDDKEAATLATLESPSIQQQIQGVAVEEEEEEGVEATDEVQAENFKENVLDSVESKKYQFRANPADVMPPTKRRPEENTTATQLNQLQSAATSSTAFLNTPAMTSAAKMKQQVELEQEQKEHRQEQRQQQEQTERQRETLSMIDEDKRAVGFLKDKSKTTPNAAVATERSEQEVVDENSGNVGINNDLTATTQQRQQQQHQ